MNKGPKGRKGRKAPKKRPKGDFGYQVGLIRLGNGFTLVELLTVISILLTISVLTVPAWNSLQGAHNAATVAYEIQDLLREARGYAMGNNTHVFVGILEENAASVPSDPPPRKGIGRVVMATCASLDGTKGYDNTSSPQTSWTAHYGKGRNLRALGKLHQFENIHIAASLGPPPPSGAMARPDVNYYYRLGHSSCGSVTPITWPIGSDLSSGFEYRFDKVIRFDPQGIPRIQYKTNGDTIVREMEIGLQQTHGNQWEGLPSGPNTGNQSAIQIDGVTGITMIFRP